MWWPASSISMEMFNRALARISVGCKPLMKRLHSFLTSAVGPGAGSYSLSLDNFSLQSSGWDVCCFRGHLDLIEQANRFLRARLIIMD